MIIGQNNLLKKLKSYTVNSLPHSIYVRGERGSYQQEICEEVANYYEMSSFDLTKVDNLKDFIQTIYSSTNRTIYTIDLDNFNDTKNIKQNALLKLYEEPSEYCYIIMYGDDSMVLDTIKTRSYSMNLDVYNKNDLLELVHGKELEDTRLVLGVCSTPGQIEIANHNNTEALFKLCNAIVDKTGEASFQNTLSISNKINFSDEYDKYDLFLFIRVLGYVLVNKSISEKNNKYLSLYNELNDMNKKIWKLNDKKIIFENFLISIWGLSRWE